MWAHLINSFLGIWLTAAPQVLGYDGLPADHDHTAGPIVASLACIAIWQVTRGLRWVNLLIGLWLLLAPWVLSYGWTESINSTLVALPLAALSCVKGRMRHHYNGGWQMLFQRDISRRGSTM